MDFTGLLPNTKAASSWRRNCYVRELPFVRDFLLYCALFSSGSLIFCLLTSAVFALIACYLWRLRLWARQAARITIALLILLFVGGVYNPFFLMDYRPADGLNSLLWRYTLVTLSRVSR